MLYTGDTQLGWYHASVKVPHFIDNSVFSQAGSCLTERKLQRWHYWPLSWESTVNQWIPNTKGQSCRNSSHVLISSCMVSQLTCCPDALNYHWRVVLTFLECLCVLRSGIFELWVLCLQYRSNGKGQWIKEACILSNELHYHRLVLKTEVFRPDFLTLYRAYFSRVICLQ